jgi:hypothetical protein
MCSSSVVRVYRDAGSGYWTVTLDGEVLFVCLTPAMAFQIACVTRHAASSSGRA